MRSPSYGSELGESEGAFYMMTRKRKRLPGDLFSHPMLRFLTRELRGLFLGCLRVATVLCILLAAGYLLFAFLLREWVLIWLTLAFALLAFVLSAIPTVFSRIRERMLE